MFLLLYSSHAYAADETYKNAIVFYEKYGSSKLIFHDGAFYYASRGKAGNAKGIRYGVEGQKFLIKDEDGKSYSVSIALDSEDNPGSCKRISYLSKDSYYHSLYEVSYDDLFNRFHRKYPKKDFSRLMYNRPITYQVDFILSLVKDGETLGRVVELSDGSVRMEGLLYGNLAGILKASNWSQATKTALPDYFGIQLKIMQPSVYSVILHHEKGRNQTYRESYVYGQKGYLPHCMFSKEAKVTLVVGDPCKSRQDIHGKAAFWGWSEKEGGSLRYLDGQEILNLTDRNQGEIHLYAIFEDIHIKLPEYKYQDYSLEGWSKTKGNFIAFWKHDVDINALCDYRPEEVLKVKENLVLYGILKEKAKRVHFEEPDKKKKPVRVFTYKRKDLRAFLSKIRLLGFPSEILTRQISYGVEGLPG